MIKARNINFEGVLPFDMQIKYADILPNNSANTFDDHIHEECEIYINLSGDVSFMVENKIYPVKPGSVIITRPCEYHHCIYHSNKSHKHFWILFGASGNEKLFKLFYDRKIGENNLIELSEKQKDRVSKLCFDIIEHQGSNLSELANFWRLISILENADKENYQVSAFTHSDIAKAIEYIGNNLENQLLVSDIAKALHISVNTLERRFLSVLKVTPSAYIKNRRLAKAAELLPDSKSVGEVCEKCGFCDYSGFIAQFRKKFGITPLKYKKLHRMNNNHI